MFVMLWHKANMKNVNGDKELEQTTNEMYANTPTKRADCERDQRNIEIIRIVEQLCAVCGVWECM